MVTAKLRRRTRSAPHVWYDTTEAARIDGDNGDGLLGRCLCRSRPVVYNAAIVLLLTAV